VADINLGLRFALHHLRRVGENSMAKAKDMECMNLLTDMQEVIHRADSSGKWVVIVCPNSDVAASCCEILAASIPNGSLFSGRTAVLKPRGRISVVVAVEEVFIPEGTAFVVSFLGWTSKNTNDGMAKWQKKAAGVFRLGD